MSNILDNTIYMSNNNINADDIVSVRNNRVRFNNEVIVYYDQYYDDTTDTIDTIHMSPRINKNILFAYCLLFILILFILSFIVWRISTLERKDIFKGGNLIR